MKNPVKNSKDKIIEAFYAEEIKACCPDGNIPNSRVAKQLELAKGNAALKYAKTLNRPVRYAKQGECQFSKEKKEKNDEEYLYKDAKESAKYLNISIYKLNRFRDEGKIRSVHMNHKSQYLIEDLDRLALARN